MAMSILCLYRDFNRGGDHGKVLFIVFKLFLYLNLYFWEKGPGPKWDPGPNWAQAQMGPRPKLGPGPKWDPSPNRARAQMGPRPKSGPGPDPEPFRGGFLGKNWSREQNRHGHMFNPLLPFSKAAERPAHRQSYCHAEQ